MGGDALSVAETKELGDSFASNKVFGPDRWRHAS